MPAPYAGDPNTYPAAVDCPVDADPPNAWATTKPLQQLADRTASISHDLPKTGLPNVWRELQRFLRGIVATNDQRNKPGVAATGGPGQGAGVIGTGGQGSGRGVVGNGTGQGAGVVGGSQRGPGGQFSGNATRAALNLAPQPAPSAAANGDVYFNNQSGAVQMRTQGTWGDVVLTGKAATSPVILNGGASDDSPSRRVSAAPAVRKLIDELANSAGQKTRIYATPLGLEVTTNCAWDAANQRWAPDTANTVAATRTAFTSQGIVFRAMPAPQSPFWEADLDDPAKVKGFILGADADLIWQGEHAVGAAGEPQFQSGWQNGQTPMYFAKDATGVVHLTGHMVGGQLGFLNPMFTLPGGYHPNHAQHRIVVTSPAFDLSRGITPGALVVQQNGDIFLASGDVRNVFVDLSFRSGF